MVKQCYYQNVLYVIVKKIIKKQEAKGILSSLGLKTPLNKIPLLGDILFWNAIPLNHDKMNETVNKFILTGDTFMPEMHLKQPQLLMVQVVHSLKIKKEYKKWEKQEIEYIFTEMN